MHAALRSVDIVCERQDGLVIAVVILEGQFSHGVVLLAGDIDDSVVEGGLVSVEVGDKLPDPSLVAHGIRDRLLSPGVGDGDVEPGVEEGLLPHTGVEDVVIVLGGVGEHLGVGLKDHLGTRFVGLANDGHLLGHVAPGELYLVDIAVLVDPDLHPFGEGVDHAAANAVKAARDLISAAAELAAGVEHGVYHLQGGTSGLGLDVHGDAPAIVGDLDDVAGQNVHRDVLTVTRQGLINGVVHDLVDQVVQA